MTNLLKITEEIDDPTNRTNIEKANNLTSINFIEEIRNAQKDSSAMIEVDKTLDGFKKLNEKTGFLNIPITSSLIFKPINAFF